MLIKHTKSILELGQRMKETILWAAGIMGDLPHFYHSDLLPPLLYTIQDSIQ